MYQFIERLCIVVCGGGRGGKWVGCISKRPIIATERASASVDEVESICLRCCQVDRAVYSSDDESKVRKFCLAMEQDRKKEETLQFCS